MPAVTASSSSSWPSSGPQSDPPSDPQSDPCSDPHSGVFSPPCAPGDVIQGKYRVEQLVGSGGMAWVFQATHLALQHRVALKILRVDLAADNTEALARFEREARAAAAVSGEATARVMDVGALDDGSPFLVMELLEGRDLDSVVQARPHLPIPTAVNYVLQACEGVAETHAAGIVHRDIKPSNLFITHTTDGSIRIKLLDFGISKITGALSDARVTVTQALVGSPVYMSPEQMRSSRDIDGRTDIWSLGVILYELLADGCLPFEGHTLPAICAQVLDSPPPPLRKIRRDIPRSLEAVVLRCLQKDPDRRFQTVADLAEALAPFGPADGPARARRVRRILEGSGIAQRPGGASPARSRSRGRLARGLAVAAALGVGTAVFMQHPSYGQSTMLAGRAWKGWTEDYFAHAIAAATQETSPPAAPAPAPFEPVAPVMAVPASTALPEAPSAPPSEPAVAAPLDPGGPPRSAVQAPLPPASHVSATAQPEALPSIDTLLAEARGETPSSDTTTARARAQAAHRAGSRKHFVTEPVASPDPAPPIVVPAHVTAASKVPDELTPYDEPVPDLGKRE